MCFVVFVGELRGGSLCELFVSLRHYHTVQAQRGALVLIVTGNICPLANILNLLMLPVTSERVVSLELRLMFLFLHVHCTMYIT